MNAGRRYLPAASLDILLPAYDPIMTLLGFRRALLPLVDQAQLQAGHEVLDVGCGTGTLAVLIKQAHPAVGVTALDPDPRVLARARKKAARVKADIRFVQGFADAIESPDASFDRVFSSMMFHHIPKNEKMGVLTEIRRVLRPGGRLEFLDFSGGTHNSLLAHALHGRAVSASASERLLARMREAGFDDARLLGTRGTIAGAIAYYQTIRR